MFNKIPPLIKINRFIIKGKDKQAAKLLNFFFITSKNKKQRPTALMNANTNTAFYNGKCGTENVCNKAIESVRR